MAKVIRLTARLTARLTGPSASSDIPDSKSSSQSPGSADVFLRSSFVLTHSHTVTTGTWCVHWCLIKVGLSGVQLCFLQLFLLYMVKGHKHIPAAVRSLKINSVFAVC